MTQNILLGSTEEFAVEQGVRMRIQNAVERLKPRYPDHVMTLVMTTPLYRNDRTSLYGRCRSKTIELAGRLFIKENGLELKQTFIHEIGHRLCKLVYDDVGHGLSWRKCMMALDSWPEPVHKVWVDWRAAPITYVCTVCGHLLSRPRRLQHTLIGSVIRSVYHPTDSAYWHKKCGKASRYVLFSVKGVLTEAGLVNQHLVVEPESCKEKA